MVRKQREHSVEKTFAATHPHHSSSDPSQDSPPHRVHHLLYFITFLLIALVLVVFFSFPLSYTPSPSPSSPASYTLTIDSLSCQWQDNQFVVCETVSWEGQDALFAKGYIPGGEPLDASIPQTTSPFTYCQPAGTEEGYRIARALLYSSSGLARDIGQGTECFGEIIAPSLSLSTKKISSTVSTGFRVAPTQSTTSRAEGIFTKKFPGSIQSCTYTGRWTTDNDQYGSPRNICHGATGTFEGYADANKQYVINNPDLFRWAGLSQAALNPSAQRYDGYGFWMESCDGEYYRSSHTPRYGAQGVLQGFGTDTLAFSWAYFDEDTRAAVDFSFDLTCNIRPA